MAKRKVSNPLALAVLTNLFERPMHPYEMAATMRERHKEDSIKLNYGSLYTVVEQLQREGFIVPRETVREGRRPERTIYAITDTGEAELYDWLRELLRRPVQEFTQFAAGLALMGPLPPEEVEVLLDERALRLEEEVREGHAANEAHMAGGLARMFLIEDEHRLVLREAELAWVRKLAGEIRDETLDGIELWRAFLAARKEGRR